MDSSTSWTFVTLSVSLLALVVWWVKKKQSYWADRGVESPPLKFAVGHSLDRFLTQKHPASVFGDYYNKSTKDFLGLYFFARPATLIRDMDLLKRIMISDFDHFMSRGVYYNEKDDPISAHLFSLSGNKWKQLRTKLTPTFTSGKMKLMFPTIVQISEQFVKTVVVESAANPEGLEIKNLTSRFTTDVIGNCAFGIECNSLKEPKNNAYRLINEGAFHRPLWKIAILHLALNFPKLGRKLGVMNTDKPMNEFYMNLVRSALKSRQSEKTAPRNDFMNILLQMHEHPKTEAEKISLTEIAAQSFLFFIAGFETSASTMTFALYELAKNPDIQDQAVEHIKTVLDKHDGQLTYECLHDLDFLERIIKETLRKYPAVPTLMRQTTTDYRIPDTDIVLPRGLLNVIPVWAIHMDPKYYKEPEKFKPERFEAEAISKRPTCAYLPFGEGPRICPGLRFGIMQAKVGLVALLTQFKFSPTERTQEPLEYDRLISILSAKGGIYLKVEQRDNKEDEETKKH